MLAWLEPLYAASQMRELDRWAIEDAGVASLDLMEQAGLGVARAVSDLAPDGPVRVVCGKGNNGGDGFVCARHLAEEGYTVESLLLEREDGYRGDALANLERLRSCGGAIVPVQSGQELDRLLNGSALVVDAIFGTGFEGTPHDLPAEAIEAIGRLGAQVVAVDVPSGVNATSGEVEGAAVVASLTVTFHAAKTGLYVEPGRAHAGQVKVVDIGIPSEGDGPGESALPKAGLINAAGLASYPPRGPRSTKFSSGVVAVFGGSTGLTGAVCMAAEAAMRTGAGYVKAVVPASLNQVFESQLLEVMTVPAADDGGSLTRQSAAEALAQSERAGAVLVGPGLGREEGSLAAAREVIAAVECPLLVDADGLNALAGELETVTSRSYESVLTPHAGELGRLIGKDSEEVSKRRLTCAFELADRAEAVVVLKGCDTIVATPEGLCAISPGASFGLATAGSGDVLAGVISALLAKGLKAFEAAALGVYIHSEAGRRAQDAIGANGMVASNVIEMLPLVVR